MQGQSAEPGPVLRPASATRASIISFCSSGQSALSRIDMPTGPPRSSVGRLSTTRSPRSTSSRTTPWLMNQTFKGGDRVVDALPRQEGAHHGRDHRPRRRQHQRIADKRADRRGVLQQRMSLPDIGAHLLGIQLPEGQPLHHRDRGHAPHHHVQIALAKLCHQQPVRPGRDPDLAIRRHPPEGKAGPGHQVRRRRRQRTDGDLRPLKRAAAQKVLPAAQFDHGGTGRLLKHPARRGQRQSTRRTRKKLCSQDVFQFADRLGRGRLRHIQRLRPRGKRAETRHLEKALQMAEFEVRVDHL